jgi:molybdopterin synthase catalytic subunit
MTIRSGVYDKGTISLQDILAEIREHPSFSKAGDIVSFTGIVRGETENEEPITKLRIEAYKEQAEKVLEAITDDIRLMKGIIDGLCGHCGCTSRGILQCTHDRSESI